MDDVWTCVLHCLSIPDLGRLSCVDRYHHEHTGRPWHWRRVRPRDPRFRAFASAKRQTAAAIYHAWQPVKDKQTCLRRRRQQEQLFHKYRWWVRQKQQKVSRHLRVHPWSLVVLDLRRYELRMFQAHQAILDWDRRLRRKEVFERYLPDYWAHVDGPTSMGP